MEAEVAVDEILSKIGLLSRVGIEAVSGALGHIAETELATLSRAGSSTLEVLGDSANALDSVMATTLLERNTAIATEVRSIVSGDRSAVNDLIRTMGTSETALNTELDGLISRSRSGSLGLSDFPLTDVERVIVREPTAIVQTTTGISQAELTLLSRDITGISGRDLQEATQVRGLTRRRIKPTSVNLQGTEMTQLHNLQIEGIPRMRAEDRLLLSNVGARNPRFNTQARSFFSRHRIPILVGGSTALITGVFIAIFVNTEPPALSSIPPIAPAGTTPQPPTPAPTTHPEPTQAQLNHLFTNLFPAETLTDWKFGWDNIELIKFSKSQPNFVIFENNITNVRLSIDFHNKVIKLWTENPTIIQSDITGIIALGITTFSLSSSSRRSLMAYDFRSMTITGIIAKLGILVVSFPFLSSLFSGLRNTVGLAWGAGSTGTVRLINFSYPVFFHFLNFFFTNPIHPAGTILPAVIPAGGRRAIHPLAVALYNNVGGQRIQGNRYYRINGMALGITAGFLRRHYITRRASGAIVGAGMIFLIYEFSRVVVVGGINKANEYINIVAGNTTLARWYREIWEGSAELLEVFQNGVIMLRGAVKNLAKGLAIALGLGIVIFAFTKGGGVKQMFKGIKAK